MPRSNRRESFAPPTAESSNPAVTRPDARSSQRLRSLAAVNAETRFAADCFVLGKQRRMFASYQPDSIHCWDVVTSAELSRTGATNQSIHRSPRVALGQWLLSRSDCGDRECSPIKLASRFNENSILLFACVQMHSNSMRRVVRISAITIALGVVVAIQPGFRSHAADRDTPGVKNPFEGKLLSCTTVDGSIFHLQNPKFKAVMGRSTLFGDKINQVGNGFNSSSASVYLPWDTVVGVIVHGEDKLIDK